MHGPPAQSSPESKVGAAEHFKKKGCLKKSYVFDGQYLFVKYQEIQVTDYIVQLSIYQLVLEPVPAT